MYSCRTRRFAPIRPRQGSIPRGRTRRFATPPRTSCSILVLPGITTLNEKTDPCGSVFSFSRGRTRTYGLQVMSLASCQLLHPASNAQSIYIFFSSSVNPWGRISKNGHFLCQKIQSVSKRYKYVIKSISCFKKTLSALPNRHETNFNENINIANKRT